MAHPKKMTTLFVLFFTTALLLGLTNKYLAREMGKSNPTVQTIPPNNSLSVGQSDVRHPSVTTAYRPIIIDAHNDPLAPVALPKEDTHAHRKPNGSRPIYEPSQDDPNILLQ